MQFYDTRTHDRYERLSRIARGRRYRRCLGLALVALAMLWLPALAADGMDADRGNEQQRYTFDIPGQSLPDALRLYGEITGVAVLIDARLLGELRSAPLSGRYGWREALQRIVDGTGLAPHFVGNGAFTLVPSSSVGNGASQEAADLPAQALLSEPARRRGARVIQRSLEQALCGHPLTRPGGYRASLRFWLGASEQRIRAPELLESTGDPERDSTILQRLRDLPLPGLPADIPQPITLLLLPESPGATPPCRGR